jgi:hypothetical protein
MRISEIVSRLKNRPSRLKSRDQGSKVRRDENFGWFGKGPSGRVDLRRMRSWRSLETRSRGERDAVETGLSLDVPIMNIERNQLLDRSETQ